MRWFAPRAKVAQILPFVKMFYGNYQNPDEFVLFKETLIKLCMELYKIGCQKEERCDTTIKH